MLDIKHENEFHIYVNMEGDFLDWTPKKNAPDYIVEELKQLQEIERRTVEKAHAQGLDVM